MPPLTAPGLIPFPRPPDPILPDAASINVGNGSIPPLMDGGALVHEQPDGGAIVDFNPYAPQKPKTGESKFGDNLALDMDAVKLNQIANDLLIGIENDENSRKEALSMLAVGMRQLGFIIEDGRTDVDSSAPLEGQSTVRHPLLTDACLQFQANARGELLPAAGPCKIRDDRPNPPTAMPPPVPSPYAPGASPSPPPVAPGAASSPFGGAPPMPAQGGAGSPPVAQAAQPPSQPLPAPPPPMMGHNGGPPLPIEEPRDEIAEAFEKDMNHYLTVTAREYYPDTDQMLFKVGFGGLGIKKVYNSPIKRRPVSESIDLKDFVVSNALTDLGNAIRKTHKIRMPQSTLRRMQLLGVYLDKPISQPSQSESANEVQQVEAEIAGVNVQLVDPKDADHDILECYCELDLDGHDPLIPAHFKGKKLPLPYRVTMEKDSRVVLEVRRNWREDDNECMAKEYFVEFPFVKAFGFYGIGLLHILGNTTKALTAAWREFIDSGMFANFPGFLFAKGAGRQLTNQFRVAPGSGVGLDVGIADIKSAVMPLPYKDLGPAFVAFIQHVEELGQRLAGTSQINVGEGRQDAPVGTTLALIEQATKATGAVQKRLHNAQAQELSLFKDRFRDDPEAFWRFNKRPTMPWEKAQFLKALDDYDLVPVSDPNNPTSLHRAAKAEWLKQTAIAAPGLLDVKKVYQRSAKLMDISDADDLLAPPQAAQAPPVDPVKAQEVAIKGKKLDLDQQLATNKATTEAQIKAAELQDKAAERQNKLEIAQLQKDTAQIHLAATLAIHADKTEAAEQALHLKVGHDIVSGQEQQNIDRTNRHADAAMRAQEAAQQAADAEQERAHQVATQTRDHEHERGLAELAAKQAQRRGGSQ